MKVYISGSLINSIFNEELASALERKGCEVLLPQRFCPNNQLHQNYPESISGMCVDAMRMCDIGVLTGDCYGHDSSWECGWFTGQSKPIVCYTTASLRVLDDWMIKHGLMGVITTSGALAARIRQDEILGGRRISITRDVDGLFAELLHYCGPPQAAAEGEPTIKSLTRNRQ